MAIDQNLFLKAGETPDAYKTRVAGYQTKKSAPVITASNLGQTSSAVALAPTINSATPQGTEQFITSSIIDPYRAQKEAEIASLKDTQSTAQSSIADIYSSLVGQGARSEDIYKQEGVDTAKKQVDDLTSQIEAEQLANRRQIEELQRTNPNGLFGGALQDETDRINRLSLQKQADLSIVQSAALRRYDTASAIADRRIQLEFEPLKVQLDALKYFYSENQATLNKEEDRLFQQKITQDERTYNEKFTAAKTLQDTKLSVMKSLAEKGASTSVQLAVQNATSPEEAMRIAAPYLAEVGDVSTQVVDLEGKKVLINSKTGETIRVLGGEEAANTALQTAQQKSNIELVDSLRKTLSTAVGPTALSRLSFTEPITGRRGTTIAGIEQLRSQLSLDSLINAKARGATFGALSEGELGILSNSATKIGSWAIKDKNGNITGYKASEKDFNKELDKINNFAKLDYILKGGAPEDVGAITMSDGSIVTENSDGTYSVLQ